MFSTSDFKSFILPSFITKSFAHQEYARMAEYCYNFGERTKKVGSAARDEKYTTSKPNGFQACVYYKEGDDTVILAIRGTDEGSKLRWDKDLKSDWQIMRNQIPEQYIDARQLYYKLARDPKYAGKKIVVVGHSLGGSLAQLLASTDFKSPDVNAPEAITFNAYSTKKIIEKHDGLFDSDGKITNYIKPNDFVANRREQPGETLVFEGEKSIFPSFSKEHCVCNFSNVEFHLFLTAK